MTVKEFNDFEMYHFHLDTTEIPRFIEEAADHVFHFDHPEGCAYGAEAQSAPAPAYCHGVRILDGQRAALWDPTAPSVEMHLIVADLEVLAEERGLKWFCLKTVTADAVLAIDGERGVSDSCCGHRWLIPTRTRFAALAA